MRAAAGQQSNGSLAAVRDLERSLDARHRAEADAERILAHALTESHALVAEARERGEREARERRDEVLTAAARDASLELAAAEAFETTLATTVSRQQHEIDRALLDIVVPDPVRER